MNKGIVYRATNKSNGKMYYGWVNDKSKFKPVYTFQHEDGRILSNITTRQFNKITGEDKHCSYYLSKGDCKEYLGWKLISKKI